MPEDVLEVADPDKSIVVIDDFFRRPDAVLDLALRQEYVHDGRYPGERTQPQAHDGALAKVFERYVGKPILRLESVFQIQPQAYEAQSYVHSDLCDWAAVLYLNKDHDGEPGTRFYRHRETGYDRFGLQPGGTPSPHVRDGHDLDKWDVTMTVPIRFNRLVLYNAGLFHRNASAWGTNASDARLVQSFFVATTPPEDRLPAFMRK